MTISEILEELEELKKMYGDCYVRAYDLGESDHKRIGSIYYDEHDGYVDIYID